MPAPKTKRLTLEFNPSEGWVPAIYAPGPADTAAATYIDAADGMGSPCQAIDTTVKEGPSRSPGMGMVSRKFEWVADFGFAIGDVIDQIWMPYCSVSQPWRYQGVHFPRVPREAPYVWWDDTLLNGASPTYLIATPRNGLDDGTGTAAWQQYNNGPAPELPALEGNRRVVQYASDGVYFWCQPRNGTGGYEIIWYYDAILGWRLDGYLYGRGLWKVDNIAIDVYANKVPAPPAVSLSRRLVTVAWANIIISAALSSTVANGKRGLSIWTNHAGQVSGSPWQSYNMVDVDDGAPVGLVFEEWGRLVLTYVRGGNAYYRTNDKFGDRLAWSPEAALTGSAMVTNSGTGNGQVWKVRAE